MATSSPKPPRPGGITGRPSGQAVVWQVISGAPLRAPFKRMVETPVKLASIVASVPTRIGTSSFTLIRTRTNSGLPLASAISLT